MIDTMYRDSLQYSERAILEAVSDFRVAIQQATSVEEALCCYQRLRAVVDELSAAELFALERADTLCGVEAH